MKRLGLRIPLALTLVASTNMALVGVANDANAVERMNGTFECTAKWADVANVPSGYAIGNCAGPRQGRPGTNMHRTWKSAPAPNGSYFDGGYIYGNFAGCGWIRASEDEKRNDASWSACGSSASRPLSSFALATNNGACPRDRCTDGTLVNNPRTCRKYANYRPWSINNRPTDYVGDVPANSNRLLWRYVSRHASSDGSGRHVMVRDTAIGTDDANWVFVQRSCLAPSLPGYLADGAVSWPRMPLPGVAPLPSAPAAVA